jgi:hypothetical protein
VYWSEWHNDPPRCCDPCDHCGNWIGPSAGSYRAPYAHAYSLGDYAATGSAAVSYAKKAPATRGNVARQPVKTRAKQQTTYSRGAASIEVRR